MPLYSLKYIIWNWVTNILSISYSIFISVTYEIWDIWVRARPGFSNVNDNMPSYLQSFEHEPFVRMLYVQYQITNIFTNTKSMWSTVLLGANSCKYGLIWDILWRAQIHDRKYMCLNINSHLITFLWHGCEQPNLKWWIARHKYEFFLFLTNIFLFTKFRYMYSGESFYTQMQFHIH